MQKDKKKWKQNDCRISTYVPPLDAEDEIKDDFYPKLDNILSSLPKEGKIIVSGDFNARVGKDHTDYGMEQ